MSYAVVFIVTNFRKTATHRAYTSQAWAQLSGGHGGRVPPLFQMVGVYPPTFFSLGLLFGEVSTIKVTFVTLCVKSFSC